MMYYLIIINQNNYINLIENLSHLRFFMNICELSNIYKVSKIIIIYKNINKY